MEQKTNFGHLIDSAANNHNRFVRGQFEQIPEIIYDPDQWNDHGYYNKIESKQIISFWEMYNRQLLALVKNIPAEKMANKVNTGSNVTIEFLIIDYVDHMEHHLKQVVDYDLHISLL